jgi:hypothetical protein
LRLATTETRIALRWPAMSENWLVPQTGLEPVTPSLRMRGSGFSRVSPEYPEWHISLQYKQFTWIQIPFQS